ncbi:MAG: hypothetical protein ACFFCM_19085 [Promethearchaeota archaeon]
MNGLTSRQISYALVFPIVIVIAVILGLLVLRKDRKYWGNRFFAFTFWFFALGVGLNFIYLFSYDSFIIAFLNYLSICCVGGGSISLLLGILVIYKGENEIIQNKLTYFFIIMMIVVMIIQGLIPEGIRVELYVPKWSIPYGIYSIIFGQALFFSILFFSIKLYRELSSEMQRKFFIFILGMICENISITSIFIKNMYIIPGYELIDGLFNLLAFISVILIYFGIIRRQ